MSSQAHTQKISCDGFVMMMDNYTYFGDNFTIYTNTASLCCTYDLNIALYVNYTSVKKKINGNARNDQHGSKDK